MVDFMMVTTEEPEENAFRQEAGEWECDRLRRAALATRPAGMSEGLANQFADLRKRLQCATLSPRTDAAQMLQEAADDQLEEVEQDSSVAAEMEKEKRMEEEVEQDTVVLMSRRRSSGVLNERGESGVRKGNGCQKTGYGKAKKIWVPGDLRDKLRAIQGRKLAEGPWKKRSTLIKYLVKRREFGIGEFKRV